MKLYHVSQDLDCNGQFTPRIPMSTLSGEDQTINRVCTAKTVEGCFSAMPCGPEILSGEYLNHGGYFMLFEIDTVKLGLMNIIDSDCLSKKSLVSDANLTGEVWILESFEVPKKDTHIIWVRDWDEKNIEDSFNADIQMSQPKEVKLIANLDYSRPVKNKGDQVFFPLFQDEDSCKQEKELISTGTLSFKGYNPAPGPIGIYQANVYTVVVEKVDLSEVFYLRGKLFRNNDDVVMSLYIIPPSDI